MLCPSWVFGPAYSLVVVQQRPCPFCFPRNRWDSHSLTCKPFLPSHAPLNKVRSRQGFESTTITVGFRGLGTTQARLGLWTRYRTLANGWCNWRCCRLGPRHRHIWKSLCGGSGNCKQPPSIQRPLLTRKSPTSYFIFFLISVIVPTFFPLVFPLAAKFWTLHSLHAMIGPSYLGRPLLGLFASQHLSSFLAANEITINYLSWSVVVKRALFSLSLPW